MGYTRYWNRTNKPQEYLINPKGQKANTWDCFRFPTWEDLLASEMEETYPLTEEEIKEMVGEFIWQEPDGTWIWYVGLFDDCAAHSRLQS